MTSQIPPSLERFGAELSRAAERELPALSGPTRRRRFRAGRPRLLAGSTLGLAGIGATLVLVLGGSAATPALAVTREADGSVLVQFNYVTNQSYPQADAKLASLGIKERFSVTFASGAATVNGPITCTAGPGVTGPPIQVLVGQDGTEVIGPGQSGGNTAEGSFHAVTCTTYNPSSSGNSGGTGNS